MSPAGEVIGMAPDGVLPGGEPTWMFAPMYEPDTATVCPLAATPVVVTFGPKEAAHFGPCELSKRITNELVFPDVAASGHGGVACHGPVRYAFWVYAPVSAMLPSGSTATPVPYALAPKIKDHTHVPVLLSSSTR